MIEIEKPKIECIELDKEGNYGKFVVEPWKEATELPSVTL